MEASAGIAASPSILRTSTASEAIRHGTIDLFQCRCFFLCGSHYLSKVSCGVTCLIQLHPCCIQESLAVVVQLCRLVNGCIGCQLREARVIVGDGPPVLLNVVIAKGEQLVVAVLGKAVVSKSGE